MIRVRFRNMWEGFNPRRNQLLDLLRTARPDQIQVVTSPREVVDLEVGSVYPTLLGRGLGVARFALNRTSLSPQDSRESFRNSGKSTNARRGIWFTPENQRPPASGWDATLSFEVGNWPMNAYLPFWQLNSDLFGAGHPGFLGSALRIDELTASRTRRPSLRPHFCCAILRNPEPVRMRAIQELRRLGRVDVFGPVARRPVAEKLPIFENYRFVLCFENDLYPGYVTEKVFDAWMSGAIPLYRGLDSHGDLNPKAIVNMAELDGFAGLLAEVERLESNPVALDEMASQPILARRPDPTAVLRLIGQAMDP